MLMRIIASTRVVHDVTKLILAVDQLCDIILVGLDREICFFFAD